MNPAYEAAASMETTWQIEIRPDGFRFLRLFEGKAVEVYRVADGREAAVWAAAIIQGYQPPRVLTDQGKPIG